MFEASGRDSAKKSKERRKSGVAYKNEPDNEDENEMSVG